MADVGMAVGDIGMLETTDKELVVGARAEEIVVN